MSLGLRTAMGLGCMWLVEAGRSDDEFVLGGGEELRGPVSQCTPVCASSRLTRAAGATAELPSLPRQTWLLAD